MQKPDQSSSLAQAMIFKQIDISPEMFEEAYRRSMKADRLFADRLLHLCGEVSIAGCRPGSLPEFVLRDIFEQCQDDEKTIEVLAKQKLPEDLVRRLINRCFAKYPVLDFAEYPILAKLLRYNGEVFSDLEIERAYELCHPYCAPLGEMSLFLGLLDENKITEIQTRMKQRPTTSAAVKGLTD